MYPLFSLSFLSRYEKKNSGYEEKYDPVDVFQQEIFNSRLDICFRRLVVSLVLHSCNYIMNRNTR